MVKYLVEQKKFKVDISNINFQDSTIVMYLL